MATIKFDKKIFENEIGKLDEKMKNKIIMFGTTIENITDKDLEIDVTPNRPDLLSYHGFKRSFLAFLGKKKGFIKYELKKSDKDYQVLVDSSVKDVRPFTVCAVVKNLKLNDSKIKEIIDFQEKLHSTLGRKRKKLAIGIYPLEKIKFPIEYKAVEPDKIKFIPLESTKEMSGLEILQKYPTGKEYASLLSGKSKFPIFIDSNQNILSMPPIINSQLVGKITEQTKDVFIECSGMELNYLKKCLNIIVTSISEMGGDIYPIQVKEGIIKSKITPDFSSEKIKISLENTNKLLGLNLNEKDLKEFLEKMGYGYSKGQVEIPPWRIDVLHEVDLIEDVAIAYGYENFTPEIPKIFTYGEENKKEVIKRKISEILAGLGMLEVSNYHLTTKMDQIIKMGISEKQEKEFISVEESKTEHRFLRKDLSHYLLKTISENVDSEYPQEIFEIGKVFGNFSSNNFETEKLSALIVPGNFTKLKQYLNYLFEMLGVDKIEFKEPKNSPPPWFVDGRVAEINFNGKLIGYLGEIHPKILKDWKIKMPVALFELDLTEIFESLDTIK